jgi:alpha,alpha-trehalase
MSSQILRNDNGDKPKIERDLCYEADPYELKLDEMFDAEPEPEIIEGLPASDALTPADRYLELFTHVQKSRIFADSKTFPDCAPKQDPLDILIHYRRVKRQPGSTCASLLKSTSGCRTTALTTTCPIPGYR